LYHEALALWRALEDWEGERRILVLLGLPGMYPADQDTAYALMATAVTTGEALPPAVVARWSDRCTLWRSAKDDQTLRAEALTSVLLFLSQIDRARGDYAAARSWLERSVALLGAGGPTGQLVFQLCDLCLTLALLGETAAFAARLADARALIPHIGEEGQRAYASHSVAYVAWSHGAYPLARALWEDNLALVRGQGDDERIMWPLLHLGDVAWQQGDIPAARAYYEEGVGLAHRVGQQAGLAHLLQRLGRLALADGNHTRAEELAAQSLNLARELDAGWQVANALALQADVALAGGDLARATSLYRASLRQLWTGGTIGGAEGIALQCIDGLAAVATYAGATQPAQRERAARLYAASAALRRVPGAARAPAEEAVHGPLSARTALHAARGGTAAARTGRPGRTGVQVSLEQVVADVLAQPRAARR
jgi:tetratricopeptide (TPR) repeat protein